jgi:hypothetical protein
MQVETIDGNLVRQIDDVVTSLRTSSGYRTVWLDPFGTLWHTEPEDEELDALGHRYVGTFCRPDADTLGAALAGLAWPNVACLVVEERRAVPRTLAPLAAAV